MKSILDCLTKNWANFKGRATRREYWLFALFNILFWIVVGLSLNSAFVVVKILIALSWIYLIIPSWAVTVRRLHDTNRSGWAALLNFVPFIGWLVLFIFVCQKGKQEENRYGPAV